jgi:hypothetical protein
MSLLSVQDRLEPVADRLRELVRMHNDGSYPEGPEALNAEIDETLTNNELWEEQTHQVDHIGVFPKNREKSGLTASDSQGLLHDTFFANGWNPKKWDCVSLQVLEEWRQEFLAYNQKIVAQSNEMLPALPNISLATGRGSHGISALRACKFPCKAAFPAIAGPNGLVSQHKIMEKQPSMRKPLECGVKVMVVFGEVEKAVPGLFQVISRMGNVTNSHYRLQSTLQSCRRIWGISSEQQATGEGKINWDTVAKIAIIGMAPAEAAKIDKLMAFVQNWSGGAAGQTLEELEQYEKTLAIKRSITADDLAKLAEADVSEYARIIPAIYICIYVLDRTILASQD